MSERTDAPGQMATEPRKRTRRPRVAVEPRLFTDDQAADYLGVSTSYVRALIARGVIRRVELPPTDERSGPRARMLRLDQRDLDRWIDERLKG
jgi:hypothetical protein